MKQPPGVILLIPSAREFDRGLRRGIVEYTQVHGPWILHEEAPPYLQSLTGRQRLKLMRRWSAQGVIVLQNRLAEVRPLGLPTVVAIGTHKLSGRYCQVLCANQDIGRLGAETLLGLGLQHFAYCGLEGLEFSDNRAIGFTRRIREAGHSALIYSSATANQGKSWYLEEREIARWLAGLRKPAGLMACNDDRARMLSEICRQQRIRVPDEVAILGVDNDELVCRGASPPLSSIALATERGGYDAAALLASIMSGRTIESKVVLVRPTHVVSRQSTDILATPDPLMVRALRFIRENSNRNLCVTDLVAVAGVSRRALQDRFLRDLARTPIQEIHRCRAERIARLLVETNMTIGEIASASGFDADAHVARFFPGGSV